MEWYDGLGRTVVLDIHAVLACLDGRRSFADNLAGQESICLKVRHKTRKNKRLNEDSCFGCLSVAETDQNGQTTPKMNKILAELFISKFLQ